jgi:hypothetical protein
VGADAVLAEDVLHELGRAAERRARPERRATGDEA